MPTPSTPGPGGASLRTATPVLARIVGMALAFLLARPGMAEEPAAPLPAGVHAEWDLAKAQHDTTATRERIWLNGLWHWQPAEARAEEVPAKSWGWFKVPGCWPGITDYMQKDCQTVWSSPDWKGMKLGSVSAAWYQRDFAIPAGWKGRRIGLRVETLNSYAAVYVDGTRAGEMHFPGGDLELTAALPPGTRHTLSLLVVALPLKGVMLSYTDSASAREVKGSVARRGLCGDVSLVSTPAGPRLTDVRVGTSVRRQELTADAALAGLSPEGRYLLQATVTDHGKVVHEFQSPQFTAHDLKEGRIATITRWKPERLWDTNTPGNQCDLHLSLLDAGGKVLDSAFPKRFGFREFWIEGRDFYLNGKRLFLSAEPLDNAEVSAGLATYAAARESLERLQSFGINYVYTHNYGCEPGAHLSFTEVLRAADDVGMLVGFSQPHFSHYDWKAPNADAANGYARHAEYYVRQTQNHPAVVMYVMSHNACGYEEDMNPDLIGGKEAPRDQWAAKNVKLAERAEAIVRGFDPDRIVYHHASGNLGVMHDSNFYPNFAPVQELSDWFETWSKEGVKPAFTCEYGAPFTWDWTMYRGWYQGNREWGSASVPWEFCVAEWNSQFYGDRAYQLGDAEKSNLRWEAKQFRAGRTWHRWDYPAEVGSARFTERYPVFAEYITDNWRAYRALGLSGNSPWEYGHYWKLRDGVDRSRKELPVDWEHLQRPGFSPDYLDQRSERMDLAYERADWIPTVAAEALLRNNRPLLAYIAGADGAVTSKDHQYFPDESVEKQILVINNSRTDVTCDVQWNAILPKPVAGEQHVKVPAGGQMRIPVKLETLPKTVLAGAPEIRMTAKFSTGETQEDRFIFNVLPRPAALALKAKIALFDPKGETAALLRKDGIAAQSVEAGTDLAPFDVLIMGKQALTPEGPAPEIGRVRTGLKVLVFEQTGEVLEHRFGFRVAEYGLRQVFPRVADHPALAGLTAEQLRDWRGASTVLPPRLKYQVEPRYGPTVEWAGLRVPRVWRCGNRGDVASVLIEKPARGDFLPLVEGGFSLQYSPLLEYREGAGRVLFCQMDVTGRTAGDPVAEILFRNLLRYLADAPPLTHREAVYAGDEAGAAYLRFTGVPFQAYDGGKLSPQQTLILGHGAGAAVEKNGAVLQSWLKARGRAVAVALQPEDAAATPLPGLAMQRREHLSTIFPAQGMGSPFAGIGPADLHNRDPHDWPLISGGAQILGDGALASADDGKLVICQIAPWQFEGASSNLRRTRRHAAVLLARLLANQGVAGSTPILERFHVPVDPAKKEQRWLDGLYLDKPEEWDDPYRFFRW